MEQKELYEKLNKCKELLKELTKDAIDNERYADADKLNTALIMLTAQGGI